MHLQCLVLVLESIICCLQNLTASFVCVPDISKTCVKLLFRHQECFTCLEASCRPACAEALVIVSLRRSHVIAVRLFWQSKDMVKNLLC